MADTKISGLPASTTPLAGTEELPIVQSGVTRKVSVANLTAGRAISATELTLSTGNLVIGTSGQGIDFSATPGTGTSELLNDYEEGTWTPSQGAGLTVVGTFSSSGTYTKIGRTVILNGFVAGSTSIACTSFGVICGSLPFAAMAGAVVSSGVAWTPTPSTGAAYISTTTGNLLSVEAFAASGIINFTISFTV